MAQVQDGPGYRVQADAGPLPLQQLQAPASAFGLGVLGAGAEKIGQAVGQAGDAIAQEAIAMAHLNNRADADVAYSQHIVDGNNIVDAFKQLPDHQAMANVQGFAKQLDDRRQEIRKTLTNPEAQSMFDQDSRRMQGVLTGQIYSYGHAANERYLGQAYKTKNESIMAGALRDPTNDEAYDHAVADLAKSDGQYLATKLDPETAQLAHMENVSTLATRRAEMLAVRDPVAAEAFVNSHKQDFGSSEKAISVIDQIMRKADVENVHRLVDRAEAGMTMPQDIPTLFHMLVLHGEMTPDGRASPMGASGPAQVMPATALAIAKQMGIPAAEMNTPENNLRIGQEYFRQQVARFGPLGGMIAYNAGPQVARDWINGTNSMYKSPSTGQMLPTNPGGVRLGQPAPGQEREWAERIPWKETRDYVKRIVEHLPRLDPSETAIAQGPTFVQHVKSEAERLYGDNHALVNAAVSDAKQRVALQVQQQHQMVVDVQTRAADLLTPQPDGSGPRSWADLRKVWPTIDDDLSGIEGLPGGANVRKAVEKGLDRNLHPQNYQMTPEDTQRYQSLLGMAAVQPAKFLTVDPAAEHLPWAKVNELMKTQAAIRKGQQSGGPYKTALSIASPYLAPLKIEYGSDVHQQFVGALADGIDTFKQIHAKDPTPKDMQDLVKNMLLKDGDKFNFQNDRVNINAVPQHLISGIIERLRALGYEPTAQRIAQYYERMKG
jgi:hypothetical protein